MSATDAFALGGRQDDAERMPATEMQKRFYSSLIAMLGDWTENGIPVSLPCPTPPEPERKKSDPATLAALRRECERLAALYRAPLPEGDAGIVAAIQRWHDMREHAYIHERGFAYTLDDENEIVKPVLQAAQAELEDKIEKWPAQGVRGVAAKLRYALYWESEGFGDALDLIDAEQLVAALEREAQPMTAWARLGLAVVLLHISGALARMARRMLPAVG